MPPRKNEVGNRYRRLLVIAFSHIGGRGKAYWMCRCDCGKEIVTSGSNLRFGTTKSCGCLNIETARESAKLKSGENSPSWHGGKTILCGYSMVRRKEHPRAVKRGYVREHILVMEKMFGGPLPEGAEVHHCNGNKTDNRPYNLRLFLSRSEHMKYHYGLRLIKGLKGIGGK